MRIALTERLPKSPHWLDRTLGRSIPVLPLFAMAMGLSAVLLFSVQPMFTKMVLPLLGGSPAVWNTAMVFFQATLLAGYLYAHVLTSVVKAKFRILLHMTVLALAFVVLPIGVAAGWTPPTEDSPIPWLFALLAVSIGLPFFAVSTIAPLLQKWFAQVDHAAASDPYFLYGVSNLGSFLALLGYPTLIEPLLGLDAQGRLWTWGFGLLVVLIGLCALALHRGLGPGRLRGEGEEDSGLVSEVGWRERLHWLLLAFFPSGLLLAVTLHLTTDVAAVPFLWVAPLAVFLLTFVLVFARRPILKHSWMLRAQVLVLIPLSLDFWGFWVLELWLTFLLHLSGLFVTAMVCHGELAKRRPVTRHLTEFYVWMSLGGVLGGIFSALVAPVLFDSVTEYPLLLVLACLMRPTLSSRAAHSRYLDLVLPMVLAGLAMVYFLPGILPSLHRYELGHAYRPLVYGAIGLILYGFHKRPIRLALGWRSCCWCPRSSPTGVVSWPKSGVSLVCTWSKKMRAVRCTCSGTGPSYTARNTSTRAIAPNR